MAATQKNADADDSVQRFLFLKENPDADSVRDVLGKQRQDADFICTSYSSRNEQFKLLKKPALQNVTDRERSFVVLVNKLVEGKKAGDVRLCKSLLQGKGFTAESYRQVPQLPACVACAA